MRYMKVLSTYIIRFLLMMAVFTAAVWVYGYFEKSVSWKEIILYALAASLGLSLLNYLGELKRKSRQ